MASGAEKNSIPGLMMEHYTFTEGSSDTAPPRTMPESNDPSSFMHLHNQKRRLLIIGVISLAVVVFATWLLNVQNLISGLGGQNTFGPVTNIAGDLGEILTSLDADAERATKLFETTVATTTPLTEETLKQDFLTVLATTAATSASTPTSTTPTSTITTTP